MGMADDLKLTILGSGTSGGVPRVPGDWGNADPTDPRNRRRRASVHIQSGPTSILIDTSPDLREQVLDAGIQHVDAVFYTHDHADHCHGIDDLRGFALAARKRVPIYADALTLATLKHRFAYIFTEQETYPAICDAHLLEMTPVTIGDMTMIPFKQGHGEGVSIGYRFGDMAFSTDVNHLDDQAFRVLDGVKVWVVDALRYDPHPTHAHLDLTLSWIERLKPERAILTHLDRQMDHATLEAQVPEGVEVAYDGMILTL